VLGFPITFLIIKAAAAKRLSPSTADALSLLTPVQRWLSEHFVPIVDKVSSIPMIATCEPRPYEHLGRYDRACIGGNQNALKCCHFIAGVIR
jgi:hypothetical protein